MGVDLKVFSSQFRERRGEFLATATPRLDRDAALLPQLAPGAEPCPMHPLPEGWKVVHYGDDGLRYDVTDRHGDPLTFATPGRVAEPSRAGARISTPREVESWYRRHGRYR
jgi:hypothetical protein